LSVFLVHAEPAGGGNTGAYLTLDEALASNQAAVYETGDVNELQVENKSKDRTLFIQAGDIVKGGRQDRVLSLSFVLPPKSGEVPIAAFCVEHGRWSARGSESTAAFASAAEAMPSLKAKLAMSAPRPAASAPMAAGLNAELGASADTRYLRQAEVWDSVAETQSKLTGSLNEPVAAAASATSLQLSLENEKLKEAQGAYVKALQAAGEKGDDIVGYVFAINGRIASADVYPSNALFRKMWPKQLAAGATAAIGEKSGSTGAPAPSPQAAEQFLTAAEAGRSDRETISSFSQREVRDADKSVYVEAQRSTGAWVHRSYLAK
jgi:hypothetical protein